jgi:trypanothione-disulfide reductase
MSAVAASAAKAVAKAFDLVVIGAGSGGLEAAWNYATEHKKTVAVVDAQQQHGPPFYSAVGGTCVNVGCVPKKLFVIGANYNETTRDAKAFGWQVSGDALKHSWTELVAAKNKAISDINNSYGEMFTDTEGLSFHQGWGRFADANTVEVVKPDGSNEVTEVLTAKAVLIATGGWPTIPGDVPGAKELAISSNEAFYLPAVPKRTLVVGGGYIAIEFACIFRAYATTDSTVTLSYRGPLFLRGFDEDCREVLAEQMRARKINLQFSTNVVKIEKGEGDEKIVTYADGKVETYDLIMYATGRHPNTQRLGLDKAGVELGKAGAIKVNPFSATNVSHIYAIGDVTDRMNLTPVAIHEAQCVVDTMAGKPRAPSHTNVPCAVFSNPQLAAVGLTEEEAKAKFPIVAVYRSSYAPLMHQLTGFEHKKVVLKIITDFATGTVIGMHLLAPEAAEMIQGFAVAVKCGAKISDFNGTIGLHPTVAEDLCSMRTPSYYFVNGKKTETIASL